MLIFIEVMLETMTLDKAKEEYAERWVRGQNLFKDFI